MSYHNGSVWPHDNALIAMGMARYGLTGHVLRIFAGLFEAAAYMDLRRLPELFCGFRRRAGQGPDLLSGRLLRPRPGRAQHPSRCSRRASASASSRPPSR